MAQLTPRQQRFCDEYLIDLNATQAAIRAGYSARSARQIADKNMSKDDIREYIEKRMAEKEDALIAKQDEVLRYLTAVMRRELYEHVVVTVTEEKSHYAPDANGAMRKCTEKKETPQTVEIPARLADANKAAELLGRRYGLFTDNLEVNGPIPIVISGGEALED